MVMFDQTVFELFPVAARLFNGTPHCCCMVRSRGSHQHFVLAWIDLLSMCRQCDVGRSVGPLAERNSANPCTPAGCSVPRNAAIRGRTCLAASRALVNRVQATKIKLDVPWETFGEVLSSRTRIAVGAFVRTYWPMGRETWSRQETAAPATAR
jgi:hypothetical protein